MAAGIPKTGRASRAACDSRNILRIDSILAKENLHFLEWPGKIETIGKIVDRERTGKIETRRNGYSVREAKESWSVEEVVGIVGKRSAAVFRLAAQTGTM